VCNRRQFWGGFFVGYYSCFYVLICSTLVAIKIASINTFTMEVPNNRHEGGEGEKKDNSRLPEKKSLYESVGNYRIESFRVNGIPTNDTSFTFSLYKLNKEAVNVLTETKAHEAIESVREEVRKESNGDWRKDVQNPKLTKIVGEDTALQKNILSPDSTMSPGEALRAWRAQQAEAVHEGPRDNTHKPLFERDAIDLIRERAERMKREQEASAQPTPAESVEDFVENAAKKAQAQHDAMMEELNARELDHATQPSSVENTAKDKEGVNVTKEGVLPTQIPNFGEKISYAPSRVTFHDTVYNNNRTPPSTPTPTPTSTPTPDVHHTESTPASSVTPDNPPVAPQETVTETADRSPHTVEGDRAIPERTPHQNLAVAMAESQPRVERVEGRLMERKKGALEKLKRFGLKGLTGTLERFGKLSFRQRLALGVGLAGASVILGPGLGVAPFVVSSLSFASNVYKRNLTKLQEKRGLIPLNDETKNKAALRAALFGTLFAAGSAFAFHELFDLFDKGVSALGDKIAEIREAAADKIEDATGAIRDHLGGSGDPGAQTPPSTPPVQSIPEPTPAQAPPAPEVTPPVQAEAPPAPPTPSAPPAPAREYIDFTAVAKETNDAIVEEAKRVAGM
jgi:hypothetical protein